MAPQGGRGIQKQHSVSAAGISGSGAFVKDVIPENLTSSVFNAENPPKDWADMSLLVPHECIRREEMAMLKSVDKLAELSKAKKAQPWQALYFCQWYNELFAPFIHEHHHTEEQMYFPWLQTKAEIPEKQFAKGHEELVKLLDEIDGICKKVIQKQGIDCDAEIMDLHTKMHVFVKEMNEHLMEEERDIPPIARANFTEEEEEKLIEKLSKQASPNVMRNIFPAFMEALEHWSPAQREKIDSKMPGPIKYLAKHYFNTDYETFVRPRRDAPLLESEPVLSRKGCCGICCFPCII